MPILGLDCILTEKQKDFDNAFKDKGGIYGYSLQGVDGIGYAAISDKFDGFNVTISNPALLKCVEVERRFINKINNDEIVYMLMEKGRICDDGSISWLSYL